MAQNADFLYRSMAEWMGRRVGVPVEVVDSVPWQERERMLDRGEAQMGFICGLPYVRKADGPARSVELLAAPVMRGARYGGRPIYFSDVIVRHDSSFHA